MAPEVPPLQAVAGACNGRSVKPSRHNKCTGAAGAWRVPGRVGLKQCFSRCISCDKCSFVSYDISAGVCSWFQQCPTLQQRSTVEANGPRDRATRPQVRFPPFPAQRTWQIRLPNGSFLHGAPPTVGVQPASIWWNAAWPLQDEETCEYRFHILVAALACPSQPTYTTLEVGAGFGYWSLTHLLALRKLNRPLVDRVRVHVLDATHSVDDCLRTMFARNSFNVSTHQFNAQRTFLQAERAGSVEYATCQSRQGGDSMRGSCSFDSGSGSIGAARCKGNMADVLESIPGDEIDVVDVDVQGWEGHAFSAEALLMMARRVKAAFIAPHDRQAEKLPTSSMNHAQSKAKVLKLYTHFSTGPWKAICLQHPQGEWKDVCDGVVAALNTKFYDVTDVNRSHVRVARKACNAPPLELEVERMNPFSSWPHWKEPTVAKDSVFQLWGTPWTGWLASDEAVSFMGLKFPSKLLPATYRSHRCYYHKAHSVHQQEWEHQVQWASRTRSMRAS